MSFDDCSSISSVRSEAPEEAFFGEAVEKVAFGDAVTFRYGVVAWAGGHGGEFLQGGLPWTGIIGIVLFHEIMQYLW